jgi:hypothetical protein
MIKITDMTDEQLKDRIFASGLHLGYLNNEIGMDNHLGVPIDKEDYKHLNDELCMAGALYHEYKQRGIE